MGSALFAEIQDRELVIFLCPLFSFLICILLFFVLSLDQQRKRESVSFFSFFTVRGSKKGQMTM